MSGTLEAALMEASENGRYPVIMDASPVSYTHLRAHETVLDLVCRLLLEKNNNIHETLISRSDLIKRNSTVYKIHISTRQRKSETTDTAVEY